MIWDCLLPSDEFCFIDKQRKNEDQKGKEGYSSLLDS